MRKYQMIVWMFIASAILLTGFKKNTEDQSLSLIKSVGKNYQHGDVTEPVKVSIAETSVIKGDKGQRPLKVMMYLSRTTTEPVTVKYKTEDESAKAGVDYVATSGSVTFEPGETAKWITVSIIGQVAADPDEDAPLVQPTRFTISMIPQTIGVIIDAIKGFISILPHIPVNVGGNQAMYEVAISFKGYTTFSVTAEECGIRKNGWVILSGYLSGVENVDSDDDIEYTGTLEMNMDIDICSMRKKNTKDEDEACGISVIGSGKVFTELKIYFADRTDRSGSRGGYIQIENKDGRFIRTVTGSCDVPQKDEEWTMVPNKTIASIFNGSELPQLVSRTLRVGRYTDTGEMGETEVWVLRKIR